MGRRLLLGNTRPVLPCSPLQFHSEHSLPYILLSLANTLKLDTHTLPARLRFRYRFLLTHVLVLVLGMLTPALWHPSSCLYCNVVTCIFARIYCAFTHGPWTTG